MNVARMYVVPSGPPQNVEGSALSSHYIFLTWDPPLFEEQNGVITGYTINVMLNETEESFELLSDTESITADLFRPFSNYIFKIAGQTAVGVGTFSYPITVMTLEDGRRTLATSTLLDLISIFMILVCFALRCSSV